MERIASSEERIRRAEEIYQQRRMMKRDVKVSSSQVNANVRTEYKMIKKLTLQILISLLIYFIFYLTKNSNYIFSDQVINKTKEFLSYDINFQNIYSNIQGYYNDNIKQILIVKDHESDKELNEKENENNSENEENKNIENNNEEQTQGGIGGGEDTITLDNKTEQTSADVEQVNENKEPLSQMEIDANDIKANYNLILPLKGTVTSRFGPRTPTDIVSANHAGIDIGVNEGTIFTASMEGTVTYVSGEGGYGNHVYIKNGDVTTLYAHCKKIYVKEGDKIFQGQQIGEVGSTGKATGPHLHFEIRKDDRVVNPEYVLTF